MVGIISNEIVENLAKGEPLLWINPNKKKYEKIIFDTELSIKEIYDAEARLQRFAPLILKYYPETEETKGLIESKLVPIKQMEKYLRENFKFEGNLLLKQDSHLKIAGSIKARGGIYEILYIAEKIAKDNGIITEESSYLDLMSEKCRSLFSEKTIHVSSTGNLGLSIGIISRTLGFNVVVHMSSDAKQWKKDLLRDKGAKVIEYDGDFSSSVIQGRTMASKSSNTIFVDDENSKNLFLGYSVAALRLVTQLEEQGIQVTKKSPLFVYIPCGVGGAPGGITFGLKQVFGDNVHVFFVEPTKSPSMLLGLTTGLNDKICVQDIGLDGKTLADGLAVGRPSKFVGKIIENLISGIFTVEDRVLFEYLRKLNYYEGIRVEPSACAAFEGVHKIYQYPEGIKYIDNYVDCKRDRINHIVWVTGGALVPEDIMEKYLDTYL